MIGHYLEIRIIRIIRLIRIVKLYKNAVLARENAEKKKKEKERQEQLERELKDKERMDIDMSALNSAHSSPLSPASKLILIKKDVVCLR